MDAAEAPLAPRTEEIDDDDAAMEAKFRARQEAKRQQDRERKRKQQAERERLRDVAAKASVTEMDPPPPPPPTPPASEQNEDPRDRDMPGELDELELERQAFEQAEKAVRKEEDRLAALKSAQEEAAAAEELSRIQMEAVRAEAQRLFNEQDLARRGHSARVGVLAEKVCVHVCVCVCARAYVCARVCACASISYTIDTRMHSCTHAHLRASMHSHTRAFMHACIGVRESAAAVRSVSRRRRGGAGAARTGGD